MRKVSLISGLVVLFLFASAAVFAIEKPTVTPASKVLENVQAIIKKSCWGCHNTDSKNDDAKEELDFKNLSNDIIANPDDFGLTNVTDPCIQLGGGACPDPDEYFFWDGLHPTEAGHKLIADEAYAALIPIPAALSLFITALSITGLYLRRRN